MDPLPELSHTTPGLCQTASAPDTLSPDVCTPSDSSQTPVTPNHSPPELFRIDLVCCKLVLDWSTGQLCSCILKEPEKESLLIETHSVKR